MSKPNRTTAATVSGALAELEIQLLPTSQVRARARRLLAKHHYLVEHLKGLLDYRKRIGIYPLWTLVALELLAHLCGAPRGPKEWALFARGLSQTQRRALGIRRQADGYPTPGATTFWRLMAHLNADALEKIFLQVQEHIRGPAPAEELIVLDGKQPRHGGGHSVLTAVTVPCQFYLGSAIVDQKTNEIPMARELFQHLDLDGRKVSLDALHTQDQTARALVLEHGADFLLTVKDNQPTLRANIEKLVPAPPADFSTSPSHPDAGRPACVQPRPAGSARPAFLRHQRRGGGLSLRPTSRPAAAAPAPALPGNRGSRHQPGGRRLERRPIVGTKPRRLGHRKRPPPTPRRLAPR